MAELTRGFKNFLLRGDVIVIAVGFGDPAPVKTCPQCLSDDLPVGARRCKHCASEQPA